MSNSKLEAAPIEILFARARLAFPNAQALRIEEVEPLSSWHNRMTSFAGFWLDTKAVEHRESLILREYLGTSLTGAPLAEREWQAWDLAARGGIPIPEVLSRGQATDGPFALIRRSPGKPPWPRPSAASIALAAQMLTRIHTIDLQGKECPAIPRWRLTDVVREYHRWASNSDNARLLWAVEQVVEDSDMVRELPYSLLHGDYHLENVLIDKTHITCVLDWEDSRIGDPRWDVAYTQRFLEIHAPHFAKPFVASYGQTATCDLQPLPLFVVAIDIGNWALSERFRYLMRRGEPLPRTNVEAILHEGEEAVTRLETWIETGARLSSAEG